MNGFFGALGAILLAAFAWLILTFAYNEGAYAMQRAAWQQGCEATATPYIGTLPGFLHKWRDPWDGKGKRHD